MGGAYLVTSIRDHIEQIHDSDVYCEPNPWISLGWNFEPVGISGLVREAYLPVGCPSIQRTFVNRVRRSFAQLDSSDWASAPRSVSKAAQRGAVAAQDAAEAAQQAVSGARAAGNTSSTTTAVSTKEEEMYKGERMAAQTAGLCILAICIVLVWFQSNAVDPSRRHDGEEASLLQRYGMVCCCCRQIRCCGICCVQFVRLLSHCSCSTLSVMGLLVFLLGYGFKQLWDQHLIQPHLEEATIYL
eukprot:Skav202280  [mRNA]  locus=scaffold3044:251975:257186:- [translate_table: standard]